ncbi:MAG TPA: hypothetical protein VIJ51_00495 [Solirubrobacteraceae bacterium]
MILFGVLGISDALAGVILGWGLATVTAAATAAAGELRSRRHASANRRAAATLILEELRVAKRAATEDDGGLLAACTPLPTDAWNQRREQLVGKAGWQVIADAFAAVGRLNLKRDAHVMWHTDDTRRELHEAYAEVDRKALEAIDALAAIAR